MSLLRFPWRFFAALLLVSSLSVVMGCGGKSQQSAVAAAKVTISGQITFTRIPLVLDSNGVPTGLETDPTKFLTQPAPGVAVRFLRATDEVMPDGSIVTLWNPILTLNQSTDTDGHYSGQVVKGDRIFVEVLSRLQTAGSPVRIVADPAGMYSSVPQADRTVYALRKGPDGNSASNLPGSMASTDTTVNFVVGLNDKWWITQEDPSKLGEAVLEETGTGSRILGIAQTIMKFSNTYGSPTPSSPVDLHYHRGVSESRGTFIEYNRDLTPLSFNGSSNSRHFFGSVRGSLLNDDAFDEGVLLPMVARNFLLSYRTTGFFPLEANLTNLTPDMALLEGLAPAMAASILKSPYLADTSSTGVTRIDIRDVSSLAVADKSPFSGPLISALAWEIGLKANGVTSPGTPTDWAKLDPLAIQRFYIPQVATDATSGFPTDIVSLYSQIARLKEGKIATETVDLAAIFTDASLTPLLQPFSIAWPRPTTGPFASFLTSWGLNPNSSSTPFTPFAFTMAKAEQVRGTFPNVSAGEVVNSIFSLSKDTAYNLYVTTIPPLPSGAQVEIQMDGSTLYVFGSGSAPVRITLFGDSTTAVMHSVRVRVLSPTVRIPDFQSTVHLDVAP